MTHGARLLAERGVPAGTPGGPRPRVLLVDPYVARDDPMERKEIELYPSLGILTLASFLQQQQIEVRVSDLTFARDIEPVRQQIRSWRPHVVGVHTKSLTLRRSLEIPLESRAHGAIAVAGGPDAATRPESYLDGGFDAVVFGEGELTLPEIAHRAHAGEALTGTPGTVVRGPSGFVRGPPRPFLKELDELPLPAWELLDMEAYLGRWEAATGDRRAAVLTSRGCPFDCSWCSKPTFGRNYRQQSAERVLDELEALHARYRVNYVRFCDDIFGIRRRWLGELLDGMATRHLDLRFECLARPDILPVDLLPRLRAAGLQRVYLGVESGSQKILDVMNRGTHLSQIERASTALRAAGIRQYWFLMLGYPGETREDIESTLTLFRRFSPEEHSVSSAVPLPGTRLYDAVKDRLRRGGRAPGHRGGNSLLFEAAYPEAFYRWEQARFGWEAALHRLEGRIDGSVLRGLEKASDRFHDRIATPLLLGEENRPPPRIPILS
ncbi:MAG: B12-binding domain-containing radical SAM protein [Thermoplasmata archaeon]|nr:B12-binding domain-containing radical SAM protein [Thermoplasmata archaeon]